MNNPEKNIDLIESYLLDNASIEERKKVEKMLVEDKSFAQLFNELKILIGGIQHASKEELLAQLKNEEVSIQNENTTSKGKLIAINEPVKKKRLWAPLSLAASIALLIGLVIFNNPWSKQNQNLASYYEPLSPELLYNHVRSSTPETFPKEAIAAKALINNDTDKATQLLHEMLLEDGNNLDTMENIIRVYTNLLLLGNQKDCSDKNAAFEQLKNAAKGSKWYGAILLDQILLQEKCKFIELSIDAETLDTLPLSEYDLDKWNAIKSNL